MKILFQKLGKNLFIESSEFHSSKTANENFNVVIILHLPFPHLSDSISLYFQGVLMYFPHEAGHETLPRSSDLEDDTQEPIFECFWQGRLAPLSYVHK